MEKQITPIVRRRILISLTLSLIAFSTPASATKIRFLLAPGAFLGLSNEIDAKSSTEHPRSGDRSSIYGFGVAIDFGDGPHRFALDYYDRVQNTLDSSYRGTDLTFDPAAGPPNEPGPFQQHGTFDRKTDHEAEGLFLGYRYHHRSGLYVGGGGLLIDGRTRTNTHFTPTATGVTRSTSGASSTYKQTLAGALTLGYDWTFKNNLVLGVHAMRSLPTNIKPDNEHNGIDIDNFYMQSISLSIGYNLGQLANNSKKLQNNRNKGRVLARIEH